MNRLTRVRPDTFTYTHLTDGDWRGISADGQLRTRLKGTREWAKKDVEIGRLQYRNGDFWVDEIDGPRNRWTVPAQEEARVLKLANSSFASPASGGGEQKRGDCCQ
jgi:hypothetical protein